MSIPQFRLLALSESKGYNCSMVTETPIIYAHSWERLPWLGKKLQEREAKQLAKELATALYLRAQEGGFTVQERRTGNYYDELTEVNLILQGKTYAAVWHIRNERGIESVDLLVGDVNTYPGRRLRLYRNKSSLDGVRNEGCEFEGLVYPYQLTRQELSSARDFIGELINTDVDTERNRQEFEKKRTELERSREKGTRNLYPQLGWAKYLYAPTKMPYKL